MGNWIRLERLLRLVLCLVSVVASIEATAMTEAGRFVGAWRLVSAEYRAADGSPVDSPWGLEPQGMLMYDAYGNMSAQLSRKDRARFAVGDQLRGTPEEIKAAFESYNAYWGRYEVDERERTVTHHVQQAMFPNWADTKQTRHYEFRDGRLILRTPPFRRGGQEITGVLVWERVR
jgi:hypothetical protein